jgi:predicted deacylase
MNYSPYHKFIPERYEVIEKINSLIKRKSNIHVENVYADRKLQTISYVINPEIKKTLMITAGCHGNEPAPIYAMLNFLSKNPKIKDKRLVIVPCISPFGFCTNVDRNINSVDINGNFFSKRVEKETQLLKNLVRKYSPSFVLNLHEDPDEKMFFLYLDGHKKGDLNKSKALNLTKEISKTMKFYKKKKIHSDYVLEGIIENPKEGKTFEDYLRQAGIPNFCTETPGLYPIKDRIEVNEKIINFVIKNYSKS